MAKRTTPIARMTRDEKAPNEATRQNGSRHDSNGVNLMNISHPFHNRISSICPRHPLLYTIRSV